jgi:group I intron endonuclease
MQTENTECVIIEKTSNLNEKSQEIDTIKTGIIYLITNKINNRKYVGQTTRNILDRWRDHKKDYKGKNYLINFAIKKYGSENFTIVEIHKIKEYDTVVLLDKLNELETFYIKQYETFVDWNKGGYNLTTGGRHHKMSESTKLKLRDHFIGIPRPNYVKEKISNTLKGRPNHINTIEKKMKSYKITFLDGSVKQIKGLKKFCRESKYDFRTLLRFRRKELNKYRDITSIEYA